MGTEELDFGHGKATVTRLGPQAVFIRVDGEQRADDFGRLRPLLAAALQPPGPATLYADLFGFVKYEAAYRQAWLELIKPFGKNLTLHICFKSPMVRMGVQVASLVTGMKIITYPTRDALL